MTNFNIQIISDTVCPWCYVGYRRLSRAIAQHKTSHPSDTFTLSWHAFYLHPEGPGYPGLDKRESFRKKFGQQRASAIIERLTSVGKTEDIDFSFGGRTGNTRDSHRLLWWAGQKEKAEASSSTAATAAADKGVVGGLQTRVVEKLFRAYFEDEKNITDPAVLTEAAVGAGLDKTAVEKFLASEDGGKEVDVEAYVAQRQLVTGVPYFMINGEYAVPGADEPETFLEVFDKVKSA